MRFGGGIHCFQQHGPLVLVEEFWGCVDMVISSCIGTTNDHDSQAGGLGRGGMVHAVVVDGWLKQMRILLKPELVSGCYLKDGQ